MALQFEVMYADRTRVRVPVEQARLLKRNNVLFMILSSETTPEKSRRVIDGKHYRRRYQWSQEDNYALLFKGNEVACWSWSIGGYDWISLDDPDADTRPMRADAPFLPTVTLVFEGTQVSQDDWDDAIAEFEADMH